jgi:manganese efflux pump family protein
MSRCPPPGAPGPAGGRPCAAARRRVGSVRLVLALLVVAVSVGLSNFAASIGLGASGATRRTRLHVALIFGLFEGGMPAVGLLIGRSLAGTLGDAAHWAGAGLLIATGGYALLQAARATRAARAARDARPADGVPPDPAAPPGPAGQSLGRLLVTGLALSMDNLVVGFAVGTFPVSLVTAVAVIAAVSVALSLVGLELGSRLGARLGTRTGSRGEVLSGLALIGVGIALAAGVP